MTNGLEQSPYDQTTLDELISYLLNEAGFLRYEGRVLDTWKEYLRINLSQPTIYENL